LRGAVFPIAMAILFTARLAFAIDPSRAVTQYVHRVWTFEQGLPQDSVQAIAQTPDGYLWVGTQEGVVRFDGASFTIFDTQNTPEISSDNITGLYRDRAGRLWVADSRLAPICTVVVSSDRRPPTRPRRVTPVARLHRKNPPCVAGNGRAAAPTRASGEVLRESHPPALAASRPLHARTA
jgi:hypothetical protein